jgi:hypothetical protein
MASLSDLPELVGFFSYSRDDDDDSHGRLSELRDGIQRELRGQLGRSRHYFRLWQDKEAIAPGKLWEGEITAAIEQAVFFIPIVTPTAVKSKFCKHEFDAFLVREHALGRNDLVFPLYYIRVPAFENEAEWRSDPVLSIIGLRQWTDWRDLRLLDRQDTRVREAIAQFCAKVADTLQRRVASPEERKQVEADRLAAEAAAVSRNPDPKHIGSATWQSFQRAQAQLERSQVDAKRLDPKRFDSKRRTEQDEKTDEERTSPAAVGATEAVGITRLLLPVLLGVAAAAILLFGILVGASAASMLPLVVLWVVAIAGYFWHRYRSRS